MRREFVSKDSQKPISLVAVREKGDEVEPKISWC